ncbi:MAG: hypothetical protein R3B82_09705 [Sandaracinaceae bacterium]
MGGRLVITDRTERIVTAHWGPLYLPLFLDSATLDALEVVDREEGALIRRHPDGITVVALVPELPLAPLPAGLRDKTAEMFGRHAPGVLGVATVIAGRGFFPSLIRSIVSGAAMMSRTRVPQKTFAEAESAIEWAAQLPRQRPEIAGERSAIVEAVRAMAADHGAELR